MIIASRSDITLLALLVHSLRFRAVYEPLYYLLSRESDAKTARFIATDRHLLEYGRELQKLYDLSNLAASMDLFIPMELFVLDCNQIKDVSRHSINQDQLILNVKMTETASDSHYQIMSVINLNS